MHPDPKRAEAIFAAALEKAPSERTSYLEETRGGDAALRQRVEALLAAHEEASSSLENVLAVAINPDGSVVLTGAQDNTAGLWDVSTGKMLALYRGHTQEVTQVVFRSDGKQVATVSKDGTARLWPTDLWGAVLPRRMRELTDPERQRYELLPTGPLRVRVPRPTRRRTQ